MNLDSYSLEKYMHNINPNIKYIVKNEILWKNQLGNLIKIVILFKFKSWYI